jgi:hypothetical protein
MTSWMSRWREHGLITEFHDRLRGRVREREGRAAEPTAGIINAQSCDCCSGWMCGVVWFTNDDVAARAGADCYELGLELYEETGPLQVSADHVVAVVDAFGGALDSNA